MHYYFSYGSNMLVQRLSAPNRAPGAVALGTALLTGRRLTFHKVSTRKSGQRSGKCDIPLDTSPASEVYGVLFAVPDLKALDEVEGVGRGYSRTSVCVHSSSHGLIEAVTYTADATDASIIPYDWYWMLVLAGAEQHHLPDHYVATYIRSVTSTPDPGTERDYKDYRDGASVLRQIGRWPPNV